MGATTSDVSGAGEDVRDDTHLSVLFITRIQLIRGYAQRILERFILINHSWVRRIRLFRLRRLGLSIIIFNISTH